MGPPLVDIAFFSNSRRLREDHKLDNVLYTFTDIKKISHLEQEK